MPVYVFTWVAVCLPVGKLVAPVELLHWTPVCRDNSFGISMGCFSRFVVRGYDEAVGFEAFAYGISCPLRWLVSFLRPFVLFFVFFFCRLLVHAAAVYNSRWPEAHKLSVRSRKKRTDFGSRVTLWSTPVLGSPSIAVTPWLAWHVPPPRPAHSATSQRHPPWRMCCPLRYVDAPMPCHVEIISHSLLRFLSFTAKNVIY